MIDICCNKLIWENEKHVNSDVYGPLSLCVILFVGMTGLLTGSRLTVIMEMGGGHKRLAMPFGLFAFVVVRFRASPTRPAQKQKPPR